MSDAVFNIVQLGAQAVHGTAVPATLLFPADAGSVPDLDRATTSPDEDLGDVDRHHAGRSYHGVRAAGFSLGFEGRFQDLMEPLNMHAQGDVAPTGGGPYVWVYDFDSTADSLVRYTAELGANDNPDDQWQVPDCLIDQFSFGYDALSVPGASPWKATCAVLGRDRISSPLTAALEPAPELETMLGHATSLYQGDVATAFGSLPELEGHLAMYRFQSNLGLARRAYGSNAGVDWFTRYGRGKAEGTFEAMVRMSSDSLTDIHDVWNVASSQAVERRWRIRCEGSGNNVMTVDHRVVFRTMPIGDRDGERVWAVNGYFLKDPDLATRCRITLTNDVAALSGGGS